MTGATNRGFSFPEQRQDRGRTGTEPRPEIGGRHGETCSSGVTGAVKDKAQDIAASASQFASDVKDKAQELTSNVADRAEQAWESTKQCTQDMAARVADTAEDAFEGVTTFIRRYPLPSLLVGFGIGFLMAECLLAMRSGGRHGGSWQL
jgi:ElaB/YqjD/DUF883 family membrane-anchored ribosome-binding protein